MKGNGKEKETERTDKDVSTSLKDGFKEFCSWIEYIFDVRNLGCMWIMHVSRNYACKSLEN